jgi:hypothetical protein
MLPFNFFRVQFLLLEERLRKKLEKTVLLVSHNGLFFFLLNILKNEKFPKVTELLSNGKYLYHLMFNFLDTAPLQFDLFKVGAKFGTPCTQTVCVHVDCLLKLIRGLQPPKLCDT